MRLTILKLRRMEAGKLQVEIAMAALVERCRNFQYENGWFTRSRRSSSATSTASRTPTRDTMEALAADVFAEPTRGRFGA